VRHPLTNPPNWVTLAGLTCGTLAIAAVLGPSGGEPEALRHGAMLVVFAGIFDMLDGRVARLVGRQSEFGVQLDSLTDLVSFGVAPAMLAYAWRLYELGPWGGLIAAVYVCGAAVRLARFNVEGSGRTWRYPGHSRGLTTTMSGAILAVFIWLANDLWMAQMSISATLLGVAMCGLTVLMWSSLPFRNFRNMKVSRWARGLFATALGASLVGGVVVQPALGWGIGAFSYLVFGTLEALSYWLRDWVRHGSNRSMRR
jgi:CDP-diacylglycerol--serine O-phosphatidyltransferase